MKKKIAIIAIAIVVFIGVAGVVAYSWYNDALEPVYLTPACAEHTENSQCKFIDFTIKEGESVQQIADNLEQAGIIRNSLAFQIYMRVHHDVNPNDPQSVQDNTLKVGEYQLTGAMSVQQVIEQLIDGAANPNVFSLTVLPGETVREVKQKLLDLGYSEIEVQTAFAKDYNHPVLKGQPTVAVSGAEPLEGYLFGDTYEFYKGESVENIITTMLDALYTVVQGNNLEERYAEHGLSLYQGITLASIVQREAGSALDQPIIAQVFYKRLAEVIPLGSDVTVKYAVDMVDAGRTDYTDNAAKLEIDSLYNTRKYTGLPPGPISNPGVSALLAVASPAETNYLYFLTGDDGKMYYSNTEAEHNQNIYEHCRTLCNVEL